MPCAPHSVMFSVLTLTVNEQMIEKLELFSPHMQNNLSTSQTDERIQKQLISSFVLKHRPYKKIKAGVFSFFQNDFQNISDQSSLSFTPNWISFLGSKADDGFMIMNWIQTPLNRIVMKWKFREFSGKNTS